MERSTTLWTFVPHSYVRYDSPQFQALFGSRSTKSVDFRQLPALAESQLEYGNDLLPNTESIFCIELPKVVERKSTPKEPFLWTSFGSQEA